MIKLTVNGKSVELNDGSTLLDASREAGVYIPTLCHYPRLPSHAVCRLCLVNVDGEAHPLPACITVPELNSSLWWHNLTYSQDFCPPYLDNVPIPIWFTNRLPG